MKPRDVVTNRAIRLWKQNLWQDNASEGMLLRRFYCEPRIRI